MKYEELLKQIAENGEPTKNRTATDAYRSFGHRLEYDLAEGFPLITTKRVHFKSVVAELLWMLSGSTNIRDLDATIWDEWADENGDLGPIYGHQWRHWGPDQIKVLMDGLRNDPYSRRHIVSAWNVEDLPDMALAPCHAMFQVFTTPTSVSLQVYQRSADMFLGVPFNLAFYGLLTHLIAASLNKKAGRLIWVGGDCHIYVNHMNVVREQLARTTFTLPSLAIVPRQNLWDYKPEDIILNDYYPHPALKGAVAV